MSDLNHIFNSDPDSLTASNIDEIIAFLRDARAKYMLGLKSAGNPKKALDLSKKVNEKPALNLDELGL